MSEHTPGPWWRDGRTIKANATSPIGPRVLSLFKIVRNYHRDHDDADLNLAAAAPDLLAALKRMVAACPPDIGELEIVHGAEAAIAKAEGTA